jgi:nucleotide-binding universal stress UspA family protein
MKNWKPVIVGVDAAPESARAAAAGWRIAQAAGVECRLVHVVNDLMAGLAVGGSPPTLRSLMASEARAGLETALRGSAPDSVLHGVEIHFGKPATFLGTLTSEAQLLVVGGKRHTTLGRWLAGSTAHQLLRDASGPLLVAGPGDDTPTRIMVALDLSSAVGPVLAEARRMAQMFGAEMAVLHVIEPVMMSFSPFGAIGAPLQDFLSDEDFARVSSETFDHAVWPLVNYAEAERIVRRGPIDATIRSEVIRWRADLLVVGSHGRGWTDRLLLGSTTHRLLGDLPASMLVVPAARSAELATARAGTLIAAGT